MTTTAKQLAPNNANAKFKARKVTINEMVENGMLFGRADANDISLDPIRCEARCITCNRVTKSRLHFLNEDDNSCRMWCDECTRVTTHRVLHVWINGIELEE